METKKYTHGFSQTTNMGYTATNDAVYLIERPFNQLSNNVLKTIKVVGSATYKTPKFKLLILEETRTNKRFKVVWSGQLINDGKYGNNIYYIEGLSVKCPANTYIAFVIEKGQNEIVSNLYTDSLNQSWYSRSCEVEIFYNNFVDGYQFNTTTNYVRRNYHFPMEFEYDVYNKPRILFKDESGDYKRFNQARYVNMAKATQTSTHITSSATHANFPFSLWQAFDEDDNTGWVSAAGNSFPKFIKYDFGAPTTVDRFEMKAFPTDGKSIYPIKYWKLLGSNDDASWLEIYKADATSITTNKDDYNVMNGGHMRYVNFLNAKPTYRYYKVEFTDSHSTTAPYDYSIAVKHMGFMRYMEEGWESVGQTVTSDDYVKYGMTKIEVETLTADNLSKLFGQYIVNVFVEDPSQSVSMVKDKVEAMWLENETTNDFDIIKYTENIFQNEVEYIVDNGNKTLYDNFTKDLDINVYSEDEDTSKKRAVHLSQDYTPLDELSGDIDVYEYSDIERSGEVLEKNKLNTDSTHATAGAYVDSIDINLQANGNVRKIINY